MKLLVLFSLLLGCHRHERSFVVHWSSESSHLETATPAALDVGGTSCEYKLCGRDIMCLCHHETRDADPRCWSELIDCERDALCCLSRPGYCNGLRLDECGDYTQRERRVREDSKAQQ